MRYFGRLCKFARNSRIDMSLVPSLAKCEGKIKNKEFKVLDEDSYIENIGKIIVRDFFPDLPELKSKLELDFDKTKSTPSTCGTPSQFGTPASSFGQGRRETSNHASFYEEPEKVSDAQLDKLSLNQYMNKYTSEDNASFDEIMAEAQRKHKEKYAWLFKNEQLQIEDNPDNKNPIMWDYKAKNAVMYVPDGVELSEAEKLEKYSQKKQEVRHENTRFTVQPFTQAAANAQKTMHNRMDGKIGLDGKEILPSRTPRLGGYNFMGTPSPAPGVDASPLMTWGEIEATPYKLDGSETPRTGGPAFKIPEIPKRDRLLHELNDKISRSHRAKKEEALKQAAATFASSPRSLMTKTERIQSMSPAAQRLMGNKLRIHTNSPFNGSSTPTPGRTPNSISTPTSPPRVVQSPLKKRNALLTDGLLKLPVKKAKASDYFD